MKISHFLTKICHFEFSNFSGIKHHRRSSILTDSCSTPNLAMETTCFNPDLQKKVQICPTLVLCSISKLSTLFWKITYASSVNCPRNSKIALKSVVGQVVVVLLIKTIFWLFWSITFKKSPGLLKFQCQFWVPWTISIKMQTFFKKVLIILR